MQKFILLFTAAFSAIFTLAHATVIGPRAANTDPCFFRPGYGAPVEDARRALSDYLKTCNNDNAPRVPVKDASGQETWGCLDEFAVYGKAAIRLCPDINARKPRIQWTCEEIRVTGEKLINKCQRDGLVGGKLDFKDPSRGSLKVIMNWKSMV